MRQRTIWTNGEWVCIEERVGPNCATPYFLSFLGGFLFEGQRHPRGDSADAGQEQTRRDRIRGDIAHRIRRACSHLDDDEFRGLVDEMTDRQLKGERRANRDWLVK